MQFGIMPNTLRFGGFYVAKALKSLFAPPDVTVTEDVKEALGLALAETVIECGYPAFPVLCSHHKLQRRMSESNLYLFVQGKLQLEKGQIKLQNPSQAGDTHGLCLAELMERNIPAAHIIQMYYPGRVKNFPITVELLNALQNSSQDLMAIEFAAHFNDCGNTVSKYGEFYNKAKIYA